MTVRYEEVNYDLVCDMFIVKFNLFTISHVHTVRFVLLLEQRLLRPSVRRRLQMRSAAVMSSCVVMGRVFQCLSAVTGLNITALTAPMSSTAVCCVQLLYSFAEMLKDLL